MPAYPLPPRIDPSFSNNTNVDYWNGNAAMQPATYDTWTISAEREIRQGMTVEVSYNGSRGTNLQANLLNPNQVPLSVVNDLIARFGVSQAVALLNSQITSAQAVAAGITPPYPNFTNANIQTNRSVAQALRPFPQYQTINLTASGGDKTGRSMYHAGILKVSQRVNNGLTFQGSYVYSKLMTDADSFAGSTGAMDAAQPELEYSIGSLDQTHIIKLSTVYELPFGEDRRWLTSGIASKILGGWRIAAVQNYASGTPIGVTSNAPLPIFNGTNRPNVTGEDWRAPIAGDEFDPLVDRFLNSKAFVHAGRDVGQRPAQERGCPAVLESVGEHQPVENRLDLEPDPARRAGRSVQSVQPHHLGRAGSQFQQRQLRVDHQPVELAEADAVRCEAGLVDSRTPQTGADSTTASGWPSCCRPVPLATGRYGPRALRDFHLHRLAERIVVVINQRETQVDERFLAAGRQVIVDVERDRHGVADGVEAVAAGEGDDFRIHLRAGGRGHDDAAGRGRDGGGGASDVDGEVERAVFVVGIRRHAERHREARDVRILDDLPRFVVGGGDDVGPAARTARRHRCTARRPRCNRDPWVRSATDRHLRRSMTRPRSAASLSHV